MSRARHRPSRGDRYPAIVKLWRAHWEQFTPVPAFPPEVRRVIYTTDCYRRLRVTWVTPLGLFTASIWKRSSSASSPSQSRSPRPSTIGTTTMCA